MKIADVRCRGSLKSMRGHCSRAALRARRRRAPARRRGGSAAARTRTPPGRIRKNTIPMYGFECSPNRSSRKTIRKNSAPTVVRTRRRMRGDYGAEDRRGRSGFRAFRGQPSGEQRVENQHDEHQADRRRRSCRSATRVRSSHGGGGSMRSASSVPSRRSRAYSSGRSSRISCSRDAAREDDRDPSGTSPAAGGR